MAIRKPVVFSNGAFQELPSSDSVYGAIASPRISYEGSLQEGTVLTAYTPWEDGTFQWTLNNANIVGATSSTYVLTAGDIAPGNIISYKTTGTILKAEGLTMPSGPPIVITNLPVWSSAIQDMRNGNRNARVLCIGDSTTGGYGAVLAGMGQYNKAASWPSLLCAKINRRGHDYASWSSVTGNNNASDTRVYDVRVSFPVSQGWSFPTDVGITRTTAGGYSTRASTYNPPSKYSFTPLNQIDTIEFYNMRTNDNAANAWVPSWNDGSDLASISQYNASGVLTKEVITTTLAKNKFNVKAFNTNPHYFAGMVAYNSAIKEITVLNMGWSGAKTTDWVYSATDWSPLQSIEDYAPDLSIICLGINDYNQASPTSQGTFESNYGTIIQKCLDVGSDVVVMIPNPIGGTYGANGNTYATYIENVVTAKQISSGKTIPVIDLRTFFVNYTTANAAGFMSDTLHPNIFGYDGVSTVVSEIIYPSSVFPVYTGAILFEDIGSNGINGENIALRHAANGQHWLSSGEGNSYLYPPIKTNTGTFYFPQTNAQGAVCWASSLIPNANCEIELELECKSVLTNESVGIMGRMGVDNNSAYTFRYSSGSFNLTQFQSGSTVIGSQTQSLTPGSTYVLKLRMIDALIQSFLNNSKVAETATGSKTSKGNAAVRHFASTSAPSTATTGLHWKSFKVSNIDTVTALPYWTSALQDVKTGIRNAKLAIISDSIGRGYYTGGINGFGNNEVEHNWPTLLAAKITAETDFYASNNSLVGNGNIGQGDDDVLISAYDNRFTVGAGWSSTESFGSGGLTTGGFNLSVAGASRTPLTFAPDQDTDTIEIYYPRASFLSGDGFRVDLTSGGTTTDLDAYNATEIFQKSVVTRSLGDNTWRLTPLSDDITFIAGIVAYNSAVKEISVLNMSWSGARIIEPAGNSNFGLPLNGLDVYLPDLTVIVIGGNDVLQGTTETNFKNAYNALIDKLQTLKSDVLVVQVPPANPTLGSATNLRTWTQAVATAQNVPLIDLWNVIDYEDAVAAGWYADDSHLIGAGQQAIADFIFERIMP